MTNSAKLEEFRKYYFENLENAKIKKASEAAEIEEYLKEYPLDKLRSMTSVEYCLGTGYSKESFCYKLEFGKYRHTGAGIGGGSSKKFGVYYNKTEQSYRHGSTKIDNIQKYWPGFRNQLCKFLTDSDNDHSAMRLEDYPMLRGMDMVLAKLLYLYYPDRYTAIVSYSSLKELMNMFGYECDDSMRCHQLSFLLNKNIRRDIPECADYGNNILGNLLWEYLKHDDGSTDDNSDKTKQNGLGDSDVSEVHYWLYSPGTNGSKWDEYSKEGVMGIGWGDIGDLSQYKTRNEMRSKMQEVYESDRNFKMDSLATWQFAKEMKPGDIVYAKKGRRVLLGRGIVTSDYMYNEAFDEEEDHYSRRKVNWTHIGKWDHPGQAAMKTLTDISAYTGYITQLEALFESDTEEEDEPELPETKWPLYNKELFLKEVFMDEAQYDTLVGLILNKKNVILQGAPGVGKTYAANRLAYSIIGEKNKDRVMMVQFHQSYSYEDFIEGFRPQTDSAGYDIKKGSFYKFCKKAAEDSDNKYFFIIDEINRGNLSKIFGELFMLIEKDKRGNSLQLLYSDEKFYVPSNVYIIGMMNTADRSLAILDYALRRRFAFYDMKPAFDRPSFIDYKQSLNSSGFNSLIDCVMKLNEAISEDSSLGEGFCIGHSYFCDLKKADYAALSSIVEYELIPLLKEYWFDDPANVRDWTERLRNSIK